MRAISSRTSAGGGSRLEPSRDEYVLVTKTGAARGYAPAWSKAEIAALVDRSLAKLRTDAVDNVAFSPLWDPDNQLLIVPNKQVWGGIIRNITSQDTRRVDLTFGIGYSDDIPKAEKVLTEIISSHDKVLSDPEPVVRLHTLGDSSVDFIVRPWAKTDDYWEVYWDITREVKRRFDEEGISIPFPQRDVHIYHEDKESDEDV